MTLAPENLELQGFLGRVDECLGENNMALSMTGYGRAEAVAESGRILIEIRTVNNRYCDVLTRMPRSLIAFEPAIKECVASHLLRGKADVFITFENVAESDVEVSINEPLAKAYSEAIKKMAECTQRKDDAGVSILTRYSDIIDIQTEEFDPGQIKEQLFSVLDKAMEDITIMRHAEGNRLKDDLLMKIKQLREKLEKVALRAPLVPIEYREKLKARMEELLGDQFDIVYDESRREAEITLFADRCAIDEELIRMRSHLDQFDETIQSAGSIGKRLDFIVQEMNREINTIGSKANDLVITNGVLDMKSELEKIREQIQNIV